MNKETKSLLEEKQIPEGFIKVTDHPVDTLSSEQKVILNRKGNILFNEGNIEGARRIFITTGYSDGLTRVADKYADDKKELKALKLYLLAHNNRKTEPIYNKIAKTISMLLEDNI
ncbi:MAG: hypothetical protein J6Y36_08010 [Treponema sp.]|uniref:hypothetical protein n=1 Tax=Treponema sp. TaxID=166 RepID=UPI001B558544|nr:hypothetical protein [Treponema sp.]MBP5403086.1 hypothetical protein [Treponema sp.]MBR5934305.1 hypothetical protein [Treponema sp.]